MQLKQNLRGDTIIEVLICIAIAGLVVAGSYAISGHSLQEGVSAFERTQANKLAQNQIEALKYREKTGGQTWTNNYPGGYVLAGQTFCLNTSAVGDTLASGANPAWLPQVNAGNPNVLQAGGSGPDHYNSSCVSPKPPSVPKYFISMSANGTAADGQAFLADIRWAPPGGGPTSESQLYYKLPPESLP